MEVSQKPQPSRPAPFMCRWVAVGEALLAQMREDWSPPVRVKITGDDGEVLDLVFQRDAAREAAETVVRVWQGHAPTGVVSEAVEALDRALRLSADA
jgi:hypothetical protein